MQNYSKPKLVKAKDGWYVFFRYNGKPKKYKKNYNRIKNVKEKERKFKILLQAVNEKLSEGWNPFNSDIEIKGSKPFSECLKFCIEKKKETVSKKTFSDYSVTYRYCIQSAENININNKPINEVKRANIRLLIDDVKKVNNLSNKAYNKHLNHLKALLSELVQWDIIETNPAFSIRNLKVEQTIANRTATESELIRIKNHLKEKDYNFYIFCMFVFSTGIRPKELLGIKCNMINLEKRVISIPAEVTKTNKDRVIPIDNNTYDFLIKKDAYKGDFYLFGSGRESGKGNLGRHEDFIYGRTPIKRDTATKRWNKLIKKELGINVNMYSLKHLGANQKIKAGINLDALRHLYGHKSKLMTERYAKEIKEVYRNEIISKSPEF